MKYLILGAGPSGLTFACYLKMKGIEDFLVIEKEEEAGGLCRSCEVDGYPFDIGGGHFLDVRRPKVNEFLFGFMPKDEWNSYKRDSQIYIKNTFINSPIEANIWQLGIDDQVEYLESIARAGCVRGEASPQNFVDWIYWKLGDRIAEDYMIPYNRKMFGDDLESLGTYWLDKLPDVSFEDTLRSCLERRFYGKQPGHAEFFYPKKYGYGEVWLRMAKFLGDRLAVGETVREIDVKRCRVNDSYEADVIVNTAPWTSFERIVGAEEVLGDIAKLRHSSIVTEYHSENLDTAAHWIYYPDPELSYHRLLVRHNFCEGSKGYWSETNLSRYGGGSAKDNDDKKYGGIGIAEKQRSANIEYNDAGNNGGDKTYFINDYAYPLNTVDKREAIDNVLSFMKQRNIYGLGRWGEWQHFNSDVVVERAMELAEGFIRRN